MSVLRIVELDDDCASIVLNLKRGTDPTIPITSYEDEEQTIIRDLSTYSARMQFRTGFNQPLIDELSTDNNRIILGNNTDDPNIQLLFTAAALSTYPLESFGDLELRDAQGQVHPVDSIRFTCRVNQGYTYDE